MKNPKQTNKTTTTKKSNKKPHIKKETNKKFTRVIALQRKKWLLKEKHFPWPHFSFHFHHKFIKQRNYKYFHEEKNEKSFSNEVLTFKVGK